MVEPLVDISLKVSESRIEHLQMYEDDEPTLVVDKFCKKFGLDESIKNALEGELNAQLDDIYLDRAIRKQSDHNEDQNLIESYLKRMKKTLRNSAKKSKKNKIILDISKPSKKQPSQGLNQLSQNSKDSFKSPKKSSKMSKFNFYFLADFIKDSQLSFIFEDHTDSESDEESMVKAYESCIRLVDHAITKEDKKKEKIKKYLQVNEKENKRLESTIFDNKTSSTIEKSEKMKSIYESGRKKLPLNQKKLSKNGDYDNIPSRLYDPKKDYSELKAEMDEEKQIREQEEAQKKERKISKNLKKKIFEGEAERRLLHMVELRNCKLEQKRLDIKLRLEEEQQTYFKPKINEKSKKIAERIYLEDEFYDCFDRLYKLPEYQENLRLTKAEVEFNKKHPFYPTLIKKDRDISLIPIKGKITKRQTEDFYRRLVEYKLENQYKAEDMYLLNNERDQKTNQKLYNPKINKINKSVFLDNKIEKIKKDIIEDTITFCKECREVFRFLESCGGGLIRVGDLSIDNLHPLTAQILMPIFQKIFEIGEDLDFEEFYCMCIDNGLVEYVREVFMAIESQKPFQEKKKTPPFKF